MQPDTSIAAYKSVTPEMLSDHHAKLISAIKELGSGTYEQLAKHIGWEDKNRASRRLKELELEQVVYKTGDKRLTSSGRNANVYALVTNGQVSVEPERVDKNTTTACDYANLIIAASGKRLVQKELF